MNEKIITPESSKRFEQHFRVTEPGLSAIAFLSDHTTLSKQRLKLVMQKGAVWQTIGSRTQRIRRAKKSLVIGSQLHLYYDETVLQREPTPATLVSDESRYSIWFKPYGMLSQGSKWGDHCTIIRWAEQQLKPQRKSFIVHRLDRAARGLIIVAHDKKAAAGLSRLFEQRQVEKRYQIWVEGNFQEHYGSGQVTVDTPIEGRHAKSHFQSVHYDKQRDRSLLMIEIETGRKHQIRRHSVMLGHAVIGDRLYGQQQQLANFEDLQLTAYYLGFRCPLTGQDKVFDLAELEHDAYYKLS